MLEIQIINGAVSVYNVSTGKPATIKSLREMMKYENDYEGQHLLEELIKRVSQTRKAAKQA